MSTLIQRIFHTLFNNGNTRNFSPTIYCLKRITYLFMYRPTFVFAPRYELECWDLTFHIVLLEMFWLNQYNAKAFIIVLLLILVPRFQFKPYLKSILYYFPQNSILYFPPIPVNVILISPGRSICFHYILSHRAKIAVCDIITIHCLELLHWN